MIHQFASLDPLGRITFVLPGSSGEPSGGSRIVYEYANRLSIKGYKVCVVHAPVTQIDPGWKMLAKAVVRYPQRLVDRSYRPDRWLAVAPNVDVRWVPTLTARFVPDANLVIATAWKTAEWVARYPASKGKKFYFIQHYEDWDAPVARVDATWQLPMRKIVIARWLQKMASNMGETAAYVPNAIDHQFFFQMVDPRERLLPRLVMLFHLHPWKGCDDGLKALEALKEEKPALEVALFGVPKRPEHIPAWIQYHQNPSQRELCRLYNEATLFLAPSLSEGWGLTALEAMACGASVVATDNAGHLEFSVHGENALLVKPGDWLGMKQSLATLIDDQELRICLASAGVKTAKRFSWAGSVRRFEEALLCEGNSRPDMFHMTAG